MRAVSRRKIGMGQRVKQFNTANPTDSAEFNALSGKLDGLLDRANTDAIRQREGRALVRGAVSARKALQTELRGTHLPHFAHVADAAVAEKRDIGPIYRYSKGTRTVIGFGTLLGNIRASLEANRDVLRAYGLIDSVVEDFNAKVEAYDRIVAQAAQARQQHVGASADLDRVADEIVQVVQVMDGFQRMRYARDPERLAAWVSASNVTAAPQPAEQAKDGGQPDGGPPVSDVRPAA